MARDIKQEILQSAKEIAQDIKRDKYLKKKYGVGLDYYNMKLKEQKGVCAVCHKPPKEGRSLCLDHNHKTGEPRGLVDFICNMKIIGPLERYCKDPRMVLNGLNTYFDIYKLKGE